MEKQNKVAIMGLQNAGKTSLLKIMEKKFDVIDQIKQLKPTKKVDRGSMDFLNQKFFVNDFGGQKRYREEYIQLANRYLAGNDILMYVVDCKDGLNIDASIEYLGEIVAFYQEAEMEIPILILFHKYDPESEQDPALKNNKERFLAGIEDLRNGFTISEFNTSVYNLFSVVRAFSYAVRLLYSETETITQFLLELSEKFEDTIALLVFEEHGISLGEVYKEQMPLQLKKKILTLFEMAQRRILRRNINFYEFSDRISSFLRISGVIHAFDINDLNFYVMLVLEEKDEEQIIEELNLFETFREEINILLTNILTIKPRQK